MAGKGQIKTPLDTFALDTTFPPSGVNGGTCGRKDPEIKGNTSLYLAELANPWTLKVSQSGWISPSLTGSAGVFW